MKRKFNLFTAFLLTILGLTLNSCQEIANTTDVPVLMTSIASEITKTSAHCGGIIMNEGTSDITLRGICYSSTNTEPDILNNDKVIDNAGGLAFACGMFNLSPGTTYYVRAFAQNKSGISYGSTTKFTTLADAPNVFTAKIDGTPYTALNYSINQVGNQLVISGINGTESFLIWVPAPPTVGNYLLADTGSYIIQYTPDMTTVYTSDTGYVDITEYVASPMKIKGTFWFKGVNPLDTIEVTNGEFTVYQ